MYFYDYYHSHFMFLKKCNIFTLTEEIKQLKLKLIATYGEAFQSMRSTYGPSHLCLGICMSAFAKHLLKMVS